MKRRFRQSKWAIFIDMFLLPIIIPIGILRGGIFEVYSELEYYCKNFKITWKNSYWDWRNK